MKNYGFFRKINKKYARNKVETVSSVEKPVRENPQKSNLARWAYMTVLAEHKKLKGGGK